ncbi:rRNA-processing protein las1 [Tulasnella sp. 403]|nr:rRNA-processing protein las1 [Tulasnella sp. 403]
MEDEGDSQETWALDQLCDVLLAKGGLVPVSKKKRPKPDNKVESPPNQAVWTPLLTHLASHHPTFPNRLVQGILSILCEVGGYISYKWSLAGWIIWAADTWEDNPDCTPEGLVKLLMELLGTNEGGDENDRALIKILLRTLTSDDPILKAKTKLLMKAIESQSEAARSQTESSAADVVAEMAGRLTHLQDELKKRSGAGTDDVEISEEGAQSMEGILPTDLDIGPGWTLLTEENWKPCPIGVFYTTSVN